MSEINSVSSSSGTATARTILKSVKFTVISYVVSVVLLALLAVLIVYTDIPEKISNPSVKAITLFGAFLSALLTSKTCETRGWLCGLFTGMFNVTVLMCIGTFLVDASLFTQSNILLVAAGGICGMIGGIIGVNLGNN